MVPGNPSVGVVMQVLEVEMELTTSTNDPNHKVVKLQLDLKADRRLLHGPAGNNITLLSGLCEPYEVVEQIKDLFIWIRAAEDLSRWISGYQYHCWNNPFMHIYANVTGSGKANCLFEVKQPIRFQLEAIQWRVGCRYDPAPAAQYLSLLKALDSEGTFKPPQPLNTTSILSAFKRRAK